MAETIRERMEREVAELRDPPRRAIVSGDLLQEADHVARYYEKRYEPRVEGTLLVPGLRDTGLSRELPQEIDFLLDELKTTRVATPAAAFPTSRARALVRELQAQLRWHAPQSPTLEVQVDLLFGLHKRARTPGDWMLALGEHLLVARQHEALLRSLPAFAPAVLDEADALLDAWRGRLDTDRLALRRRRATLATMLRERIRKVVRAADFVYRDLPAIAAEARSERLRQSVERAARARRRTRKATTPAATPTPPVGPTEEPTPA